MINAPDDITVAKAAACFHYSFSYLTAMHRRAFNVDVTEQIVEYRTDHVREPLSFTAPSAAGIAREVDYASPEHFMCIFKRRTDPIPGRCRDAFPTRLYDTV